MFICIYCKNSTEYLNTLICAKFFIFLKLENRSPFNPEILVKKSQSVVEKFCPVGHFILSHPVRSCHINTKSHSNVTRILRINTNSL